MRGRIIEVECTGGRSGSGPATWGQEAVWSVVRNLGADAARYNVSAGSPAPAGMTAAVVTQSLRKLVLMHDSLRTRLLLDDDGSLRQVVDGSGGIAVTSRTLPDGDGPDAEQAGSALLADLASRPFDTAREWPIRVGMIESGGRVRYLAYSLAHTAVDAWGLRRMLLDLGMLATGHTQDRISELRPALQPLEEADFQRSPRGRRQDAASRRHWRTKADLGPARMFPGRPGPMDGPRFPNAVLNSPALDQALRQVAAARRVSSSAVLLAAVSAMLGRLSGSPDAVLRTVVNNRFQPRLTNAVSSVAQEGLFHLPNAGGEPFADLARRAQSASLATYRSAYYDKALLDREIEAWSDRDGVILDTSCVLNDYRGLMPAPDEVAGHDDTGREARPAEAGPPPAPLAKELNRTTLTWPVEHEPRHNLTFALDALDAPGAVELAMTADSAVLSRSEMERMLFGVEDLIVSDALDLDR